MTDGRGTKADLPNGHGLSEQLEQLRPIYEDRKLASSDREHAFYRYWTLRIANEGGLSHDSIVSVLKHRDWAYPVGDIIYQLCIRNSIRESDIDWLMGALSEAPGNDFAVRQLRALRTLEDRSKCWRSRLSEVLSDRADWAARRILSQLTSAEVEEAIGIISSSSRPARSRNKLIEFARQVGRGPST